MGPDRQKVKDDTLQLDRWGGFHYEFKSDPAGKKGHHLIVVKITDTQTWQGQDSITIDYYQPNTLEMKISGVAERYLPEDTFRPMVSGSYLAGNPMAGDAFSHGLGLDMDYSKVFIANGLERYGFWLDRDLAKRDPTLKGATSWMRTANTRLASPWPDSKKQISWPISALCYWKIG